MKTFTVAAAIAAVSISAFTIAPAFAQDNAAGHYEWQWAPQSGPRAPLQAPRRFWVPNAAQVATCNCGTKGVPGMASPSCASAG